MSYAWVAIFAAVFAWSAIDPQDTFIWFLEVLPAIIGLLVLAATRRVFPLTTLAYVLVLVHCIILMVGGHYTYSEVPLFDWLREVLDHERNNYDKVGHFAQGFVPAILAREILIRKSVVNGRVWLNFFVVCFCLAFSALYELIEWLTAVLAAEAAEAFLGTQGYIWDTQADMGFALLGALLSLLLLGGYHDRQLESLKGSLNRA
jgi:putative membrane protein